MKSLVLMLALVLLALGGVGAWLLLSTQRLEPVAAAPAEPGPVSPPPAASDAGARVAKVVEPEAAAPIDPGVSTVAWPVKVSLELVRAARAPEAPGVAPLGSGRNARLSGRIVDVGERGVPAEIRFVGGANDGRVLQANAQGEFGASDLYPGLAEVHVSGAGVPGSVREVRLRQGQDEELNISYALPGSMVGTVFGPGDEPLEGVKVELEGHVTETGADGVFSFPVMTAGINLLIVLSKPGFASYSERVAVPAARAVPPDRYKFRLEKGASLEVSVLGRVGDRGEAQVLLLPQHPNATTSLNGPVGVARGGFPWYRIDPVKVFPGGSVRIDDLPPERVMVRVFHRGANADPGYAIAALRSGDVERVEFQLEAAPKVFGVVKDPEGRAVENAVVRLEAPDRTGAMMMYLGEMPMYLETEIIPSMPPAVQETHSDNNGRFTFTSWSRFAEARYLTAQSADGSLWGGRVVKLSNDEPGDREIELEVQPVEEGRATLSLEFPGRHQGLPVELTVDGHPLAPRMLAPGDPFPVENLAEGDWRLHATFHGRPFLRHDWEDVSLRGDRTWKIELPQAAIDGQDEDTLLRTGRLDR